MYGHKPVFLLDKLKQINFPADRGQESDLAVVRLEPFSGQGHGLQLTRLPALCRFLDDGRIDLDNNPVEHAIRHAAHVALRINPKFFTSRYLKDGCIMIASSGNLCRYMVGVYPTVDNPAVLLFLGLCGSASLGRR